MLLNCHTYYSLKYGTYTIEDLIHSIKLNGYSSFVVADVNNTSAILNTVRLCKEAGLKPIAGIDFRNGAKQMYVGIALNNQGFKELNVHLSAHLHTDLPYEPIAPEFDNAYIIYPLQAYKGWKLKPNEFVGISIQEVLKLNFMKVDVPLNKLVALHTVSFAGKRQFNIHRLLRAVDNNILLSKLPTTEQALGTEMMIPKIDLYAAYKDYPHIIRQTENILQNCSIDFIYGKLSNKNLKYFTTSIADDLALLRSECLNGIPYRYPNPTPEVMKRVEKELDVIGQLNFASYYLINWDITKYARHKNYYYVGRGSGANSIVAYLLRITDVDPIELDLYFERFINIYRNNAPDFDIDFSWTDRDDITQYIFDKYGQERSALLGSYNTFKQDAAIREIGKVFGLPPQEIDLLQRQEISKVDNQMGKLVLHYSQLINDFPSYLSIHASGILISEEPINTYSATFMPPKGFPTTQFSMLEAEDIGLYKFDILSQRGLGKIKDSISIIKKNHGHDIDIHNFTEFKKDQQVKNLLLVGDTIGCFYVESPAMRMLLTKLRADDYLRLVAASSIIRPGVAQSGMMREYIVRFRDLNLRKKAREKLPELYDLLEETYGVMVYQEDVIKIAHLFAGLGLMEADYLRRGMSWKFKQRNEFQLVKDKFFVNCRAKGYQEQVITQIWFQIESFANFAFSKGHSASYAVESFQALYLKAHYPLEYMVATLNNGGGFYRYEVYLHEARMKGANIHSPCINKSDALTTINGKDIYIGLGVIAELERQVIHKILQERDANGCFKDLSDFVNRVPLSIEQMRLLIRANVFLFTGKHKSDLLWQVHTIINPHKSNPNNGMRDLFPKKVKNWKLPKFTYADIDQAYDELELLGFPLCSPFALLKTPLNTLSTLTAQQLKHHINKQVTIVGYFVNSKRTSTAKGERMYFGTFLDHLGHWIDTVHFPNAAKSYPFIGPGCYLIKGKVTEEYDFISLEVDYMKRLEWFDRT